MSQLPEWFNETRWVPPPGSVETRRVYQFMTKHGFDSYRSMLEKAASEQDWFYRAAFNDLDLTWLRPFDRVVDASEGQAWARWFTGGQTNLAHLTCTRWAHRDVPALIWEGDDGATREYSFGEFNELVSRAAAGFRTLGLRKGDVLALYAPMLPEAVVAFFAAARMGAITTTLFSGYGTSALIERLRLAQAKVVVTADGFLRGGKTYDMRKVTGEAVGACPSVEHVVAISRLGQPLADALNWDDLLQHGDDLPVEGFDPDTPFLLGFTSGSTGSPKGVVHVHGGFPYRLAIEMAYNLDVGEGDRFTWITDMGWIMGPVSTMGPLSLGATAVLFEGAPNYPDAGRLWRFVSNQGVTHLGVSPTLVRVLAAEGAKAVEPGLLSPLKVIGITGEPCTPPVWRWLHRYVGEGVRPVVNWTGGAEMGSGILIGCPAVEMEEGRFAGPTPGLAVDVFDENGRSVVGRTGELVITHSSPTMTKSLWNERDRYFETYWSRWPDVWVHGDQAIRYEDGSWELPGRSDDVINVAGKRVGPAEFEAIANAVAEVVVSAAVGVPHPVKGQTVVIAVVLKKDVQDHQAVAAAVMDTVTQSLGKPLKPEAVLVVPELPLTLSNKVHRRVLRSWLTGEDAGNLINLANPEAQPLIVEVARTLEIGGGLA